MSELSLSYRAEDSIDAAIPHDVLLDSMKAYLREIGQLSLLTAEQELALAQRIADGMLADEVLQNDHASADEHAWATQTKANGMIARQHLIEANLRLVVSIAKRFMRPHGLSLLDLIQEGNVGLMHAVTKFDHRMGNRFSTYASFWIRQAVIRAQTDQSRTIRLPAHVRALLAQIRQTHDRLEQASEQAPSTAEIALVLGQSDERIREVLAALHAPIPLETPVDEDDDQTLGDSVPDDQVAGPVEAVEQQALREHLIEALQQLPERCRCVIEWRIGLHDNQPRTLVEIGRLLGITRERVRQIEAQALRALRKSPTIDQLSAYMT